MNEQQIQIEHKVGSLYSSAVTRFPTYETVVHREFCKSMLEAFPDPDSVEGQLAYEYARDEYDYLTPEQIAEDNEKNKDDGICSHGLDWLTCPCGCFETD
jgi:hypothetical protein